MKSCPKCQRTYPDDAAFCAEDGSNLVFTSMLPVAPDASDPRIGQRIGGRYEIRRVVADGGMGRVYEGVDKQGNARIAVKILHKEVNKDEVALERFKREFEISSALPHDHIVKVMDFQQDAGQGAWVMIMEFLDGEELRIVLKRDKFLPPERLIRMMSQVAMGLDEAHARQFVHRDLKPDNIFLCGTREGDVVKLLDFGSVKDKNKDAKKLTVMGTTIGSPYYMAPEQAQGLDTLDARADVFALAAIAYECVTGTVPFQGTNGPSILLAILTKEPDPPSKYASKAKYPIPPGLDEVMESALVKNPNIRTKTVGLLADAIGHAYALPGDHKAWAKMPLQELAKAVDDNKQKALAARAAPVAAVADPFARPDPFSQQAQRSQLPSSPFNPQSYGPPPEPYGATMAAGGGGAAMDQAFQGVRQAEYQQGQQAWGDAAGVPQKTPWLLPVIVGVCALVLGGGIAIVVVLTH